MNARTGALVLFVAALGVATVARPAHPAPFGLQSVVIDPLSGLATPASPINVDLSGVAPDWDVPRQVSLSLTSPGVVEILLTSPGGSGVQVPQAWMTSDFTHPALPHLVPAPAPLQLQRGVYDFYVRGIRNFGTPAEIVEGPELAVDDFVVVPEPAAALSAVVAVLFLALRRR